LLPEKNLKKISFANYYLKIKKIEIKDKLHIPISLKKISLATTQKSSFLLKKLTIFY
jgi:hypothetical protein